MDLPSLHRLRSQVLAFDTVQQLTRGNPLRARAFLDYLDPARGIYTALMEERGHILLAGQITHAGNRRSSNLSFITPSRGLTSKELPTLLEHLAEQAGDWGTFHMLAEADEHSHCFDILRSSGFSVYAWQRIWKYHPGSPLSAENSNSAEWQPASERDQISVRGLCQSLVPAFVQPIEHVFDKKVDGWICRDDCNLIGYADVIYGREGTWVQPYIHPEAQHVPAILKSLLSRIETRGTKGVYICVRSYQAWIESVLEELPVLASPRQALMVKHLAIVQKALKPILAAAIEKSPGSATVVRADTTKRM